MKVNFKIKLTNGQEEAYRLAHEKDTKQLVLVWSRQSGKSVFAEIMLIENLLKKNKFSDGINGFPKTTHNKWEYRLESSSLWAC